MARASNAFTFLWNVSDFRMIAACTSPTMNDDMIRSPTFRCREPGEWCLVLEHNSEEAMDVSIEFPQIPQLYADLYVRTELFLGSGEEQLISTVDGPMEDSNLIIGSLVLEDVLNHHLQNDTLTLRIKMDVSDLRDDMGDIDMDSPTEEVPHACTATSRLKKYRKRVVWSIDGEQQLGTYLRVTSPYKHLPAFRIVFTDPEPKGPARFQVMLEGGGIPRRVYAQCNARVMQSEREHHVKDHACLAYDWTLPPFVYLDQLRDEGYFRNTNGVLHLLFDFFFFELEELLHESVKCSWLRVALPKPRGSSLGEDLGRLYASGEDADAEVRCGGRVFRVHRLVLGARSAVFEAMFRADMAEAKARVAEVPDLDPDTLHRLLVFLYSNSVEQEGLGFAETASLYAAADKYQVLPLRCHCSVALMTMIAADNACEALRFADLHRDRDLLDCAVEFVRDHLHQVLASREWADLMKESGPLAASVMRKMLMDE